MMGHHLLAIVTPPLLKQKEGEMQGDAGEAWCPSFWPLWVELGGLQEVLPWGSQERSLPRAAVPCCGYSLSCCQLASGHPCFPWFY